MAKLNIANLKKTLYYLQRNGLRETWISVRERLTETDRYFYVPCPEEELERQSCRKWDNPVTLSIVVPLYRTPEIYLNRMITSVMQQSYPHWELILADATEDHSVEETLTNQGFLTERLLENAETIAADARIHYIHLTENAGIAANTNQALPYARGEYIGLLDHDDVLTPDALYEMADAITKANDRGVRVAFAYSDEDKCNGDETKYYDPNHKEDFNYDLILSNNYICHFLVMDADLMKKLVNDFGFLFVFGAAQFADHQRIGILKAVKNVSGNVLEQQAVSFVANQQGGVFFGIQFNTRIFRFAFAFIQKQHDFIFVVNQKVESVENVRVHFFVLMFQIALFSY